MLNKTRLLEVLHTVVLQQGMRTKKIHPPRVNFGYTGGEAILRGFGSKEN